MCWLSRLFSGTREVPSPSDIVPKDSIIVVQWEDTAQIIIDYSRPLNIPFTKTPKILHIMDIPDTNSMDGLMDYGNNPLYIEPADEWNHIILCDWLEAEFQKGQQTGWKQGGANDCVYRVMENPADDPRDFTKVHIFYAIHRIWKVGRDTGGRWWKFKGINNPVKDPVVARDKNILWLSTGVVY